MEKGWIKLPRKAIEVFGYTDKLYAYIYLESIADFATGMVNFTLKGLASRFNWSRGKARRFYREYKMVKLDGHPNGHQTDTPTDTLNPLNASLDEGERTPQRTPDGHPNGHIPRSYKNKITTTPPLSPQNGGKEKTKKPRKKRTAAPDIENFVVTAGMLSWFNEKFKNVPKSEVANQTEAMLNYHRSRGNLMADWSAAWRTWMTNWQTNFGKRGEPQPPPPSSKESDIARLEALKQLPTPEEEDVPF